MTPECHPISTLPDTTPLFRDFAGPSVSVPAGLRRWYPADPFSMDWAHVAPTLSPEHRNRLADALLRQTDRFDASGAVLANIERLKHGASAVVTGQQVGLFGGPLLTLLKAATAIRKAQDATRLTGREHVPIFWLASEDHDLAEVDQVSLLSKTAVETLHLNLDASKPLPVGARVLGDRGDEGHHRLAEELDKACELLGWAPICDLLRECYTPGATLASAFGRLITKLFAPFGLIVMDAASRDFHALGASTLQYAIEHAAELDAALIARSHELPAAGYHAQVLVSEGHSLLFLLEPQEGATANDLMKPAVRLPLRRNAQGVWKAGPRTYTTVELLDILATEPERLSPNALLRPVFQDTILPTAAYIGGPAEIAYFAQSAVVYEAIFGSDGKPGRITPVLPRLSATLIEPAIAQVMQQHEVTFSQVIDALSHGSKTPAELATRLGARAMPIEAKRKLAAVGNALDTELTALTEYMTAMSPDLGRSATISRNKLRYQMNRLRRMAANFELQKQASLNKHATAIALNLYPEGHLQERLLAGIWFLAHHGDTLPALLVDHAAQECPGHRVIFL
ncbi:bacillithiol biosynthesis cysteine-adding enzyme BshC [Granulicella sp. 5B5]|uniref:bacillithiol biosynthesis cysteine-adding enzyme BshC n=1 Tax=Granulicella sp. 5B5 TaxID=1617967 RepID=UPI0015F62E25|nr:bacillithiol biosynthesis cysteine-adding enzyme BshC [Granulicella sp. 5B5]QMV19832.1 bacillithiol biosynthesis cysteine-adding enzyme BshC [Granulicella sp. 5B5]